MLRACRDGLSCGLCHSWSVTYDPGRRGDSRVPVLRNEWREPLRAQRDPLAGDGGRPRSNRDARRQWRKQGLGSALLTHSFALFQERGYIRAGLGVDASSLTNAVALYERAGMHVHSRYLLYRKMLRGDAPEEP